MLSLEFRYHSYWTLALLLFTLGCSDGVIIPDDQGEDDWTPRTGITGLKQAKNLKSDAVCGPFESYYFEFLDDTRCRKRLPTNRDRNLQCPNRATSPVVFSPIVHRDVEYQPATDQPIVDDTALSDVVPGDLNITLILVRRVGGKPYYRYLSNGSHNVAFQPWSTTKFMAAANAGSRLRMESNGRVGLTGLVGETPIGDLVSMVHNYDERRFTSNGLARWFLNVGTRSQLSNYLHGAWLDRPLTESLGGNYGHPTPKIGYEIVDSGASVTVEGRDESGRSNRLSTRTIAEFLKRLVMHREDPRYAVPHLTWSDVQVLLYGAEESRVYRKTDPQGMEADTAVYLQQAFDIDGLEERTQGQWRVFSKLGFGYARGGEFVHAGYGCFPVLDTDGQILPDQGKEFIVVSQISGEGDHHRTDKRLAGIYRRLIHGVMDGTIK